MFGQTPHLGDVEPRPSLTIVSSPIAKDVLTHSGIAKLRELDLNRLEKPEEMV